ncbi:MAG: hypothetical protein ACP5L2_04350 [Conexivisphaera sp.]
MPYYLPTIAALDVVSAAVALAVAYVAYRYNRLLSGSVPAFLGLSFSLLGLGLLLQGVLAALLFVHPGLEYARLFMVSSYLYLLLQIAAYLVLAVGYTGITYSSSVGAELASLAPALAWIGVRGGTPLVLVPITIRRAFLIDPTFFDAVQLISIILLALVVFDAVQLRSHASFSGLVLGAFLLMLMGHAAMLAYPMGFLNYYLVGNVLRFLGFALLLMFLLRGRHVA